MRRADGSQHNARTRHFPRGTDASSDGRRLPAASLLALLVGASSFAVWMAIASGGSLDIVLVLVLTVVFVGPLICAAGVYLAELLRRR